MTAAQELFELLKDAKPGPNYQPKPTAAPAKPDYTGRLYVALTPSRVELPALGGGCEIVYDWNEGDER